MDTDDQEQDMMNSATSQPVLSLPEQSGTNALPYGENIQQHMMQMEEIAKAFVEQYYMMFDNNRSNLPALYDSSALLSFEGHKIEGVHHISLKLSSLPFEQSKHAISTVDCQPSGAGGGLLVFVGGTLHLPGEEHPLRFSQMFHLIPTPEGTFALRNDIFRLNYC